MPRRVPTAVSEELFAPISRDVELCYQTYGDPSAEPLLLIMGLGAPMTWWNPDLCRMLADSGFFVIRYDNRDTGRSSRVPGKVGRLALVRAFAGGAIKLGGRPPYTLSDLGDDGFGLLDHLGIDSAHLVGVSMGGMIAQTMTIEHQARVRSLTSIMSTTGRRTVGWQTPALIPHLLTSRGPGRDAYVAGSTAVWKLISSPSYPLTDEAAVSRAEETYDRGVSRSGVMRHMLAIVSQPDRTAGLHAVHVPTLVIHGLEDKMVHVSGGRATAAAVPRAELLLIDGMGHDIPAELFATFTEAIRKNADRA